MVGNYAEFRELVTLNQTIEVYGSGVEKPGRRQAVLNNGL